MKKGKKVLLTGLLAVSCVGIATASALIISGASVPAQEGTMDSVLYLDWGSTESLGQIKNLTPDAPEYRCVSVAKPVRSALAPEAEFKADLQVNTGVTPSDGKTLSAAGISVLIYDAPFQDNGQPGAEANQIGDGALTISSAPITDTVTDAKTYYLKITISSEAFEAYADAEATTELAAKIVFSYGAKAAA